ncbi:MAG TPA: hypothetical protein VF766_01485 [Pyrinomonadaceae bacterium]
MIDSFKTNNADAAAREASAKSEVGDVEDAGETTAAGMIHGPVDTKPVGADTMLKVSDEPAQKDNSST